MTIASSEMTYPLWRLGFRPFFLLGSAMGAVSIAVWLLSFSGVYPEVAVDSLWHAHEMLHGFVVAIIVGFLLTASSSWSGRKGLHGVKLAALTSVWLSGRMLFLLPGGMATLRAVVDLIFLPFAIILLYPFLKGTKSKKNLMFVFLLSSLWFCNVVYHQDVLGFLSGYARKSLLMTVQIVVLILVVISGRVMPFFTEKAIPQYVRQDRQWLERLVVISTLLFIGAYLWSETGSVVFWAGLSAAGLHLLRVGFWFESGIWRKPILLILYIAYGWLGLAFLASALAARGLIVPSVATHAFTTGAISIMIVGMMTRVTLGHTGRTISASMRTVLAYSLICCGAVARVFLPLLFPGAYVELVVAAGLFWLGALILFLFEYAPMLAAPRQDGKAG